MANYLSVRRVMVQTLDEQGNPEGPPTYGVMAADDYAQAYIDIYETFEQLNDAIEEAGSILDLVDPGGDIFQASGLVDTDNYFGPGGSLGILGGRSQDEED